MTLSALQQVLDKMMQNILAKKEDFDEQLNNTKEQCDELDPSIESLQTSLGGYQEQVDAAISEYKEEEQSLHQQNTLIATIRLEMEQMEQERLGS